MAKSIRLIIFFSLLIFLSNCSSLKTSEYRSQGSKKVSSVGTLKTAKYKSSVNKKSEEENGNPTSSDEEDMKRFPNGGNFSFRWPVEKARLSQKYHLDREPHYGLDLAAAKGTPIYASHSGFVIYSGSEFSGYGKFVIIEHPSGWSSFYGHLDHITAKEKTFVNPGDRIGEMGDSGNAKGVHLHFELRKDKNPVDPEKYLP